MPEASLKAWYSMSELASLSGTEPWRLRRFLKRHHPDVLHRNGTDFFVYLFDLKTKLEGLWQSILEMETIRARLGSGEH